MIDWKEIGIKAAKAAIPAVLGALGMVGVQNSIPAVGRATVQSLTPPIPPRVQIELRPVELKPKCPDIYLDNVKIERRS